MANEHYRYVVVRANSTSGPWIVRCESTWLCQCDTSKADIFSHEVREGVANLAAELLNDLDEKQTQMSDHAFEFELALIQGTLDEKRRNGEPR